MKLSDLDATLKRLRGIADLREQRDAIGTLMIDLEQGADLVISNGIDDGGIEITSVIGAQYLRDALRMQLADVETKLLESGVEIDEAPGASDVADADDDADAESVEEAA